MTVRFAEGDWATIAAGDLRGMHVRRYIRIPLAPGGELLGELLQVSRWTEIVLAYVREAGENHAGLHILPLDLPVKVVTHGR